MNRSPWLLDTHLVAHQVLANNNAVR